MIQAKVEQLRSIIDDTDAKQSKENSMKWSDVTKNPGRKAIMIGIFLSALDNFSGSFALLNYTAIIFEESGSFMSSNESALIVCIFQLFGTIIMPFLIDKAGRKVSTSFLKGINY